MDKHTIKLALAQDSLEELFEILDRFGVSHYQKLAKPTLHEYQGQDWREVTVNGVKGYFHATGEPLGD